MITGGARRIGAAIARELHDRGLNVVLHCRQSQDRARELQRELEARRPDSVEVLIADLNHVAGLAELVERAEQRWQRLDALVNNASSFYPTPLEQTTPEQWDDLLGSNLRAPYFLAQAAAPALRSSRGCIVNLVDIHADRPMRSHPVYSIAKAGLVMLTRSLAMEMAPEVRVNGVAPGAILWPEHGTDSLAQRAILDRVPLGRAGSPGDIARTVSFLLQDAPYVTGQVLAVDGGRNLNM